jgi:hypothetical protein
LREQWRIRPEHNAEFVWHMEDVLDVYTRPYDPRRPQVCLDETSRQVLADPRAPLPPAPSRPTRHDPECVRDGVVNLFLVSEPLRGRRRVRISEKRTRLDWAHCTQELVDVHYPDAERIVLVMDQLNTQTPASLFEAFTSTEAKRLADKLEIHHAPKHGSWLNMAEIELSILQRQCLDRRLGDWETVEREVAAWVRERNEGTRTIDCPRSIAVSPPTMLGSSSSGSISHFSRDRLLEAGAIQLSLCGVQRHWRLWRMKQV